MTKAELINDIRTRLMLDLEHRDMPSTVVVGRILDSLGDIAGETLARGGEVPLPGVGKLATKVRKGRWGRNPQTGDRIYIPDCRCLAIRPSKDMREAVKEAV